MDYMGKQMSIKYDIAHAVSRKFEEKQIERYNKGVMPLLGSKWYVKNRKVKRSDGEKLLLFAGIMILFMLPAASINYLVSYTEASDLLVNFLIIFMRVYTVCLSLYLIFDLDTLQCYLFGYNNSVYYLATGLDKSTVAHDQGLIGEYKGYVLSRGLKVPHKVLYNVCVPMRNGNFQEVDSIIITRNIIYVLECKNRGGKFVGKYDEKKWVQYIGSQQHEAENIYMQNQQHTMAIDQFLLDKGIIQNGQNVCINVVFAGADMQLPKENQPLDFVFGGMKYVRKYINENDARFDDGTDTTALMNCIYEALLPYALYTPDERKAMMAQREEMMKSFSKGEFVYRTYPDGIPGVTNTGEAAVVRFNRIYRQLLISDGKSSCWQTRTDIPDSYC